jgi:hypothetical protein
MEAKIIYTDTGKNAIDKYLEEQKKQLERKISEKKYVLGDEIIEITASDIKLYSEQEFNQKRKIEIKKRLLFFSLLYALIGIIMVFFGFLYPIILEMLEYSPTQFIIITTGIILTFIGGCFYLYHFKNVKK